MMVNFTAVANAQVLRLTASGVADVDGNVLDSVSVPIAFLIGDVNGNGAVNASDVAQAKSQLGQTVSSTNFRFDVNANGTINATDVAIIKTGVGTDVP